MPPRDSQQSTSDEVASPTGTDDIDSLTERQLDTRIAAAERAGVLKRKRRELARLLAENRGDDLSGSGSTEQVPAKRPRSELFSKTSLSNLKYKGKSRHELSTFLVNLKSRFHLAAPDMEDETSRVIYASTCFEEPARSRWTNFLMVQHKGDASTVTWNEFDNWLRSNVSDQTTSSLSSAIELAAIRQRDQESFGDFLERYEKIETEDPDPIPDRSQAMRLLARLNDKLREKISQGVIPDTRMDLIAAAQKAELLAKITEKPKQSPESNRPETHRSRSYQARSQDRGDTSQQQRDMTQQDTAQSPRDLNQPRRYQQGRKQIVCYNCGEEGHIAPKCPHNKVSYCYKCKEPGHIARNCPITSPNNNPTTTPQGSIGSKPSAQANHLS